MRFGLVAIINLQQFAFFRFQQHITSRDGYLATRHIANEHVEFQESMLVTFRY